MQNFISEQYIKDNSPVTSNIDPKDLFPHVDTAERLHLQSILGSEFYADLKKKYSNQTLNSDERELMKGWIKPADLWRTLALALPWIHFNLRNKGLMSNTDDNAAHSGTSEMKFMLNETQNRAQSVETELVNYLCKNSSKFPLYTNQNGLIPPDTGSRRSSGIIIY